MCGDQSGESVCGSRGLKGEATSKHLGWLLTGGSTVLIS